jgi:cob(I)alamin adenosyltransferase
MDGFHVVTPELTEKVDALVHEIEAQHLTFTGWAMPGDNPCSAALDLARTVCRRAERNVVALHEAGQLKNPQVIIHLNRLADALWLLARWVEGEHATGGTARLPSARPHRSFPANETAAGQSPAESDG